MQSKNTYTETEQLKDYFRGMKQARPEVLVQLQLVPRWHELAERELERRATLIVQSFDSSLLTAIAIGEVNVHKAIADVLASK